MEWGHYTSGSAKLPADARKHTQACLLTPAPTNMHVPAAIRTVGCMRLSVRLQIVAHTSNQIVLSPQKGSAAGAQASWLFCDGSELTANYSCWPTRGPWWISARSVFTHTPAPHGWGDSSTARSTQPFCNTSRNSLSLSPLYDEVVPLSEFAVISPGSLLKMSNLSQCGSQGWLPTHTHTHRHHTLLRTWSAFMLLCNLSNCLGMWWMGLDLKRGGKGIRFALRCCSSYVTA